MGPVSPSISPPVIHTFDQFNTRPPTYCLWLSVLNNRIGPANWAGFFFLFFSFFSFKFYVYVQPIGL